MLHSFRTGTLLASDLAAAFASLGGACCIPGLDFGVLDSHPQNRVSRLVVEHMLPIYAQIAGRKRSLTHTLQYVKACSDSSVQSRCTAIRDPTLCERPIKPDCIQTRESQKQDRHGHMGSVRGRAGSARFLFQCRNHTPRKPS